MTYYEIDATALRSNIRTLMRLSDVPVWGVLKCDGYGVGLVPLARILRAEGVSRFAVCEAAEAAALRRAGLTEEEILLLRPLTVPEELRVALESRVIFSVGSTAEAETLRRAARGAGQTARVHVAVDTGMGRFGFPVKAAAEIAEVYRAKGLSAEGIYSHFAACDTAAEQLRRFTSVLERLAAEGISRGMAHIAASGALFLSPEARLDAVRLGSALVGRAGETGRLAGLRTVGTLVTEVCAVRTVPAGTRVGYGGEMHVRRETTLAVLAAGWWQGLPERTWGDRLRRRWPTVRINGAAARLIATGSACHAIADVTGLAVRPGDEARADINPLRLNPTVEKRVI